MRFSYMFAICIAVVTHCYASSEKCPPIEKPENGSIIKCTAGENHMSVCTALCDRGYKLVGGSRLLCWCRGGLCGWQGIRPSCKFADCDIPDYDIGRLRMVDKWPRGFAAVVEFDNVPSVSIKLTSGWSMVIVFDRPLGMNATIKSWNAEISSTSYSRQTFTLVNAQHNTNLSKYLTSSNIRWLLVANELQDSNPESAYVGLYGRRVRDATCLNAPRMPKIKKFDDVQLTGRLEEIPLTDEREKDIATKTPVAISVTPNPPTTTEKQIVPSATTQQPSTTEETTEILMTQTTLKTTTKKKKKKYRRKKKPKTTKATTTEAVTTISPTTQSTATMTAQALTKSYSSENIETNDTITMEKVDGRFCILQRAEGHYKTQDGWEDGGVDFFSGNAILLVHDHLLDWSMLLIFDTPIEEIQVWSCSVMNQSEDGLMWTLGPNSWNMDLYPGEFDVNFIAKQKVKSTRRPFATVFLCSHAFLQGDTVEIGPSSHAHIIDNLNFVNNTDENAEAEVETSTTVTPAPTIAPKKGKPKKLSKADQKRCAPSAPNGVIPRTNEQIKMSFTPNKDGTKYNYNEVLHKSILFFESARAGVLPKSNRIPWRGDSSLKDGCDIGVDLSGGWYDAGDHVKFHLPMASSLTALSWGGLLFRDSYKDAGEITPFLASLRWATNYFIASHISKYELVGQVGNGQADHKVWGRPEEMTMKRPTYILTAEKPGSEVAAETAAALAASSMVLKYTNSILAKKARKHAKELFEFADKYRGVYHKSIPEAAEFYTSYSGYNDELIWAATWLYKATENEEYLTAAKKLYITLKGQYMVDEAFSWDSKLIGAQVLLANITGEDIYRKPISIFLENLQKVKTTPKGLYWLRSWGPNRYAANAAFIIMAASTLTPPLPKIEIYKKWAEQQIHYLLGDSGRSYVIGFGKNYPMKPHHRSSTCPPYPQRCDWKTYHSSKSNYFTLYGALVGGPSLTGIYLDNRAIVEQSEVACDYNAGFQGAVAGLKHYVIQARPPKNKKKMG